MICHSLVGGLLVLLCAFSQGAPKQVATARNVRSEIEAPAAPIGGAMTVGTTGWNVNPASISIGQ